MKTIVYFYHTSPRSAVKARNASTLLRFVMIISQVNRFYTQCFQSEKFILTTISISYILFVITVGVTLRGVSEDFNEQILELKVIPSADMLICR